MKLQDTGYTTEEIKEMADKYMISIGAKFNFVLEHADGMYVYDTEGNKYLDFYGGIAVNSLGTRNEKVVAAIKGQADEIIHASNYPYTIPQAILAKTICESIDMDKIFFQNSGTEANECMIKMARKYGVDHYGPNKYEIITAKKSFHGRTYGSLSATGQPDNGCQAGFKPVLPGFTYAEFNNLEDFASKVTENTIAIMVEPVQGESGVFPATEEFMQGLRKLCDDKGLMLLLDEVQTGWGRTGSVMSYMGYGIEPDAVSMAKAMGGGMPIGACAAKAELASSLNPGSHGSTYGGNPVACAAALAAVQGILEQNLSGKAEESGAYLRQELAKLPHVKEVRGRGLLVGCEYDIPMAADLKMMCARKKLLITAVGTSISRIVPPLIVTKEEIDTAITIMREAITEVASAY